MWRFIDSDLDNDLNEDFNSSIYYLIMIMELMWRFIDSDFDHAEKKWLAREMMQL